jgi:hypothetical protein
VRAVITESFERIHRSNLVGMGVLPLQFAEGVTRQTLGLDGSETFTITGVANLRPRQTVEVQLTRADGSTETFETRCRIDTVTEREEGVRGHGRTFHFQPFITCLDTGNFRGVDAAHLACAYPDGHVLFRIDDGVGFHELRHFPAEQRITQFLFSRLTLGDHAQVGFCHHTQVTILNQ